VFTHCRMNDPENPCNSYAGCNKFTCQVAMSVVAAQGVTDKAMLASLGTVFRRPRYAHLSSQKILLWGSQNLRYCSCGAASRKKKKNSILKLPTKE
jgi:hypothetical protein